MTLLIDTSGKQVSRQGDKKKVLGEFVTKLFKQFQERDLLRIRVVLFGDYRNGQVSEIISPEENLNEQILQQKMQSMKWFLVIEISN